MDNFLSPLRYPGGKGALGKFLSTLVASNDLLGKPYYELYAGGAGAALYLLMNGIVNKIHINDADRRIYAFWYCVLNNTDALLKKIDSTETSIDEWKKQRIIYESERFSDIMELGFATFFLNRTSRSGILYKSGPIGGIQQDGNYTIGVRFNKENLKKRIIKISSRKKDIILTNEKAETLLTNGMIEKNSFTYLDPPYYNKGKKLYLNNYTPNQHIHLSEILRQTRLDYWLVSYDNTEPIRQFYSDFRLSTFELNYSLQNKRQGSELLIFSDALKLPENLFFRNQELKLLETVS